LAIMKDEMDNAIQQAYMWKQEHFKRIFPEAHIDAQVRMYTAEAEDALLSGNPDYVLDAIDNIETKVSLIQATLTIDSSWYHSV
jgi:tRNA A37 threonylcarbamoyladenosine dehydratase